MHRHAFTASRLSGRLGLNPACRRRGNESLILFAKGERSEEKKKSRDPWSRLWSRFAVLTAITSVYVPNHGGPIHVHNTEDSGGHTTPRAKPAQTQRKQQAVQPRRQGDNKVADSTGPNKPPGAAHKPEASPQPAQERARAIRTRS